MGLYTCTKSFRIPEYSEDGSFVGGAFCIKAGTEWTYKSSSKKILGADCRLVRKGMWIEISKETFADYFEPVKINC